MKFIKKYNKRKRIKLRIRKNILGRSKLPRMSVFKSSKEIYVQIIDDINAITLTSMSSMINDIKSIKDNKNNKSFKVGEMIADKAKKIGIKNVIFDRNGYLYHGRIKSLANGARKNGLKF